MSFAQRHARRQPHREASPRSRRRRSTSRFDGASCWLFMASSHSVVAAQAGPRSHRYERPTPSFRTLSRGLSWERRAAPPMTLPGFAGLHEHEKREPPVQPPVEPMLAKAQAKVRDEAGLWSLRAEVGRLPSLNLSKIVERGNRIAGSPYLLKRVGTECSCSNRVVRPSGCQGSG